MDRRPDWMTDEQYEDLRATAMRTHYPRDTAEYVFPRPFTFDDVEAENPIPDPYRARLCLTPVWLRGDHLATVMLPDWLHGTEPEALRWVPGPAAAEAVAAWCRLARQSIRERETAHLCARCVSGLTRAIGMGHEQGR
jgi:hypothetical protein